MYYQGLYIIFQMDWKRYIITLAKILQSSLRPEVYPEMSDSIATTVQPRLSEPLWPRGNLEPFG